MKPVRVLIVEDERLFSDLLRISLQQQPGLEVVGTASNGSEAIDLARTLRPQVVVMDIELRKPPNGIEAGLRIKEENPNVGIVLLSNHKDRQYIASIQSEKASGWSYLLKSSVTNVSVLGRALEGASDGLVVLDPQLVSGLRPRSGSSLTNLTPRKLEVLSLMAQGYSNAAIAEKLILGEKSVENYINAIYQELQTTREENTHPRVKAVLTYLRESQGPSS